MRGEKTINDVRSFWERNPLWTGESSFAPGSREFFDEHRRVVIDDCLAGGFDPRLVPPLENREAVLDLGCGPGFWTVELARNGCSGIVAADLTENALELTRKRCELYGVSAAFARENAESLSFADATFAHVNCQGVIHHTPDTEACVREIARVLGPGGTASISVYYLSPLLRHWGWLRAAGSVAGQIGIGLKGRGREGMLSEINAQEIVRMYDGAENPIGKAYSREAFEGMLRPVFELRETFLHFFPARALPFRIPRAVHRQLDRRLGLMIYATVVKT